ncbi:Aldo/keto reductase [Karstenula rhodostoma CBS 690.94]|uniref:Aldo/keto reductase n=1 Tax=Karstenula rhodostoma CBS 690.94 TaxID=1392251 RepID=A0A9P4PEI9_9PLEO|nr:Aldo/keto reductase [Karstenula rhodostoma CBS 690.94]
MSGKSISPGAYRRLGNSGLHISALSLSSWLTFSGHVENELTFSCMEQAYDCGITLFNIAENYTARKSEIGAVNGEVLVNNHGLSRKHIVEGLRASLKRLDLEYVDIVYAHRPDRLTPMEETVRAFNHSADEIAEACRIAKQLGFIPPVIKQPQYNLLARKKVKGEFQRLYSRFGIDLTTFSPLKFSMLSGKYNNSPKKPPTRSRFAEGQDRFCLENPNVSSVIMGASRPEQVVENCQALQVLDKLTPEVLAEIDGIVGKIELDPARQD